jgi:bifunctional non-homologous end joining protein LigD
MLAAEINEPFDSAEHIFEVAWDGLRALAYIERDDVRIQDSYGRDVSGRFPELQSMAAEVNGRGLLIDGEIVVLDEDGVPHFDRLLDRLGDRVPETTIKQPAVFQAYDILYREGKSVMNEPLRTRKRMLRQAVRMPGSLSVPDFVERDGIAFFEAAREHGLAGTVAKDINSPYLPDRVSRAWQLTRIYNRREFVIGGFTYGGTNRMNRPRHREPFASLLLGAYDRWQQLTFVGEVMGGFDTRTQAALSATLEDVATPECPFATVPVMSRLVFWCRPALVASVAFSQWTPEGRLQFPKFESLRPDVPADGCRLPTNPA